MLQTGPDETTIPVVVLGELVILFTGELKNIYGSDTAQGQLGYAALAEYRDQLEDEGYDVILIDGGESLGREGAAVFENGNALWDIVNATAYNIRVPGVLELSEGVEALEERSEQLTGCTYVSCNLIDVTSGSALFDPYAIVDVGDLKIGFVGITSPAAAEYVNDDYDLCQGSEGTELYDAVQQAIDDATDAGAEYVIAVGNLGTDPGDSPWTSSEIIANTTGIVAFLNCGSGSVIEGNVVADKDDFEIPVCAVGSEFNYVGCVELNLNDGTATVTLLDELDEEDRQIQSLVEDLNAQINAATEPTEESTESTEETTAE